MNKFNLIVAVVLVITVVVLYHLIFPPTENSRIEKNLYRLIALIESKKAAAAVEMLDEKFSAPGLNSREEVLQVLRSFFFQSRNIKIKIEYLKHENDVISRNAEEARILVVGVVTGETSGQKFQGFGKNGIDTVLITFRRHNGDWRPSAARYIKMDDPVAAAESIFKSQQKD